MCEGESSEFLSILMITMLWLLRGNHQKEGSPFELDKHCALVMRVTEVLLFFVIAAKYRLNLFKSDTTQAFLNGDIGDEKKSISSPDWWTKRVSHECALN